MPVCNQRRYLWNFRIFYVNDKVTYGNTATRYEPMTAAYKETDVTIRIRSNCYYSAEYRIAVHPTIRPRSEYEANIRYSPNYYPVEYQLKVKYQSKSKW